MHRFECKSLPAHGRIPFVLRWLQRICCALDDEWSRHKAYKLRSHPCLPCETAHSRLVSGIDLPPAGRLPRCLQNSSFSIQNSSFLIQNSRFGSTISRFEYKVHHLYSRILDRWSGSACTLWCATCVERSCRWSPWRFHRFTWRKFIIFKWTFIVLNIKFVVLNLKFTWRFRGRWNWSTGAATTTEVLFFLF